MQKEIDTLKEDLKKSQKENNVLEDKLKELQKKPAGNEANEDAAAKLKMVEAELKAEKEKHKELQENFDKTDKQVQKYKQKIAELEKEMHKKLEESTLKSKNETHVLMMNNSKIEEMTKSNHSLNKKLLDQDNAYKALQDEMAKLEAKFQKDRTNLKGEKLKADAYKAEIKALQETIEKRDAEVAFE